MYLLAKLRAQYQFVQHKTSIYMYIVYLVLQLTEQVYDLVLPSGDISTKDCTNKSTKMRSDTNG